MQERQQKKSRRTASKGQANSNRTKRSVKSIKELAAEARSLATREDWNKLPKDLSKRFDEYSYQLPQDD